MFKGHLGSETCSGHSLTKIHANINTNQRPKCRGPLDLITTSPRDEYHLPVLYSHRRSEILPRMKNSGMCHSHCLWLAPSRAGLKKST